MVIKAIGFDLFGTLVDAHADENECALLMWRHLQHCGYEISQDCFLDNYRSVVVGHKKKRYEAFQEVNNCIWVADTLNRMGIETEASNLEITSAVDKYFSLWQLTIVSDAFRVLERLSRMFKIALISNFTYSAFVHRSLRKLGIEKFFDHIIDSDTVGWRKPHSNIFKHFLKVSKTKAEEAVFIGDELEGDIKGAKDVGIQTVLLTRPSSVRNQQTKCTIIPDYIVSSLIEFEELLTTEQIK